MAVVLVVEEDSALGSGGGGSGGSAVTKLRFFRRNFVLRINVQSFRVGPHQLRRCQPAQSVHLCQCANLLWQKARPSLDVNGHVNDLL